MRGGRGEEGGRRTRGEEGLHTFLESKESGTYGWDGYRARV